MMRFVMAAGVAALGLASAPAFAGGPFPIHLTMEYCWGGVFDINNLGSNCNVVGPPTSGVAEVRVESDFQADICELGYAPFMQAGAVTWNGNSKIFTMDFNQIGYDTIYMGKRKSPSQFGGVMTDSAGMADPLNNYNGVWDAAAFGDVNAWSACCGGGAGC